MKPKIKKINYRSSLEESVKNQLESLKHKFEYETEKVQYIVPEKKHTYNPDFILTKKNGEKMYVECKGRWTTIDRKKLKLVKEQNPEMDLRILIQFPNQKLTKTSKTTYKDYAEKIGLIAAGGKTIPEDWLSE